VTSEKSDHAGWRRHLGRMRIGAAVRS
jgi:hypothetical protein